MENQFNDSGFYFQWHFLESCNLSCKHCYQKGSTAGFAQRHIVEETLSQILASLSAWKVRGRVSLTGGEPLLDMETLQYILREFEKSNLIDHVGILTNGTLITDEIASWFAAHSKIKEVQVSLDGSSPEIHDRIRGIGCFSQSLEGLRTLIRHNIPTAIMFTANKLNFLDAENVVRLADREGVNAITVERYTPNFGSHDPLSLSSCDTKNLFTHVFQLKTHLAKQGSRIRIRTCRPLWNLVSDTVGGVCPVGYSCLTILHDGTMLPCRRLPIPLGTIQKDGIFKVWYTSPILRQLRNRHLVEGCFECPHAENCGGCRAAAYAVLGDFMKKDPLCWR